jgi:hypothetical protein
MALTFFKSSIPYFMENLASSLGYSNDKNQILDPITTSVRLSLLIYKPMYTKIGINRNRVNFQEPNIFQGIMRKASGDQRTDIHILISSIKNLINWYNISDKRIRYICNKVIAGLDKLSKCYKEDEDTNLVSQTINFFIDEIKRELGELYIPNDDDSNKSDIDTDSIMSDRLIENNIYYEYFKKHWNEREIMIVYNQLKELEIDEKKEKRESIIESIENLLKYKDRETYKYMTSLTKY